jgi:hypothetical protein
MPKKKTTKPARQPKTNTELKTTTEFKQLIVTLDTSSGEITKVEGVGATGKRYAVSDAQFAKLAGGGGENELAEVGAALEDAYAAGIHDGIDDATISSDFSGDPRRRQGVRESVGEQVLRSGIRRFILRQALRRNAGRAQAKSLHRGAQQAP